MTTTASRCQRKNDRCSSRRWTFPSETTLLRPSTSKRSSWLSTDSVSWPRSTRTPSAPQCAGSASTLRPCARNLRRSLQSARGRSPAGPTANSSGPMRSEEAQAAGRARGPTGCIRKESYHTYHPMPHYRRLHTQLPAPLRPHDDHNPHYRMLRLIALHPTSDTNSDSDSDLI